MHRIVPAEILAAGKDVSAERRERQFAALVALVAFTVAMHLFGERPAIEARYRGRWRIRQTIQQSADLPIIEHPSCVTLFVPGENVGRRGVTLSDQFQHAHFRGAKSDRKSRQLL